MYRVCIEKTTGKLIEYQSGNVNDHILLDNIAIENRNDYIAQIKADRLNSLKENAIVCGYTADDIIVKEVTDEELSLLKEKYIDAPQILKTEAKEALIASAKLKLKAILTDEEIKALF